MADILFLTLKVFSSTGGIEKVCRVAGKAIYEYGIQNNKSVQILSMYDDATDADDNRYFPSEIFSGFGINKIRFMKESVMQGRKCRVIVLSHVNLLLAGWLIKKISPHVKIILLAHGVEIWDTMSASRKRMMVCCDEVVSVSAFTRDSLIKNEIDPALCTVINNCLDPYLPLPKNVNVSPEIKYRYGFKDPDKILFTLSRLSARERYKGYDKVMEAMVLLNDKNVKYLISGSYDDLEKRFIEDLIVRHGLNDRVVLSGYIEESEVAEHFAMSDCYVMPSVKEGFGIVFIEAMYYNLPAIAGSKDGSVDALKNGEFGILVDPDDIQAIANAIHEILSNGKAYVPDSELILDAFGYDTYKTCINDLLNRNLRQQFSPSEYNLTDVN